MRVRESLSHGLAPEIGDVRSVLASKIGAVETIAAMATVLTPAFTLYGWLVMAVAQTQPRLAHHNLTTGLPDGLQSTLLHNTMSRFGGNSVAMLSEHWVMNAVLRNTKMVATSVVALAAGLGNVSALGSAPMQRREAEVLDAGDALGAAVMRLDELGPERCQHGGGTWSGTWQRRTDRRVQQRILGGNGVRYASAEDGFGQRRGGSCANQADSYGD